MKILTSLCIAALTLMLFSGCTSARHMGRADARRDIAGGILGLEVWGLQAPFVEEHYYPLLRQRYGIQVSGPGCLVTKRVMEHAEGYNEIMEAEMQRCFGTSWWQDAMTDAKKAYDDKQKGVKPE